MNLEQLQKDNAAQAEALRRTAEKCNRLQAENKALRKEILRLHEQQLDVQWEVMADEAGLTPEQQEHIKQMADDVCRAADREKQHVKDLEREVAELRAWKEQATAVLPDYQAIGKALNVPLGQGVSEHLLPGILNLLKDRHELVIQLRRQQAYCTRYVRAYQSTARYREVEALLDKHHHSTVEP